MISESDRKLANLPDDHPALRNPQTLMRRDRVREQIAQEEKKS